VGCQLKAPADLPPDKELVVNMEEEAQSGGFGGEKIFASAENQTKN
jgi:hypothetical protein